MTAITMTELQNMCFLLKEVHEKTKEDFIPVTQLKLNNLAQEHNVPVVYTQFIRSGLLEKEGYSYKWGSREPNTKTAKEVIKRGRQYQVEARAKCDNKAKKDTRIGTPTTNDNNIADLSIEVNRLENLLDIKNNEIKALNNVLSDKNNSILKFIKDLENANKEIREMKNDNAKTITHDEKIVLLSVNKTSLQKAKHNTILATKYIGAAGLGAGVLQLIKVLW